MIECLNNVNNEIIDTCQRCNRDCNDISLIAVSKTKPISMIEELYKEGIRDFGENHVKELIEKSNSLPKDIRWHMIGHLQTNKVRELIKNNVFLIHSVDSLHLAEVISKESKKTNVITNILIEVNISNEESKYGCDSNSITELIMNISKLDNIKIHGLMTVAPKKEDDSSNRRYFKKLKELRDYIESMDIDNVSMDILSMGMSGDFDEAILEGATHIRVGTKLFGKRDYNI